jgi:hypothetical protein
MIAIYSLCARGCRGFGNDADGGDKMALDPWSLADGNDS